ncbi:MAG: EAL domain-containing protein, partial [Campylobacterota bacterium]|nr:EAL domain-containing protein [Campylobacterota bacterium]
EWMTIYAVKNLEGVATNYIGVFVDITEKKRAQEHINQLAYYDTLTSLPNRRLFQDRISQALKRAQDKRVALFFVDLDNFKSINDTLGHDSGDLLLKQVSLRIVSVVSKSDTVARLGGDEFTVILEEVEDRREVVLVAQSILDALKSPFVIQGREVYSAASIGISLFPDDANSVDTMMKCADSAMYLAKERGKQGFEFYRSSMNQKLLEQLEIENGLRKAIVNGELQLHYQPQVALENGKIVGVEALLRWYKNGKFISPDIFIPIAEISGVIGEIELWVLQQGAKDFKKFKEVGVDIVLSLNISDYQFKQKDFISQTIQNIGCIGEECRGFNLELTERIVMDSKATQSKLDKLKALGFQLSLDDFGTGYSSLSYLKKFNIDKLKIDKSFIEDIAKDQQSFDIVHAIISLAKSMGMETVAEGVETQDQLDTLQELGCDIYQGWYFSKAIEKDEFIALYQKSRRANLSILY